MFAPDTPPRESGGYPEPGAIQDVASHPDNDLPGPMQPAMKHSTEMAGDVIPMRDAQDTQNMSARLGNFENKVRQPAKDDNYNVTKFPSKK